MYNKIKCSKEDTECVIPSRTREKINKAKEKAGVILSIGGVFLVLASFQACSGAEKVGKDIETTTPTVETTYDNTTTKKYEVVTTTEPTTTKPTEQIVVTTEQKTTKQEETTTKAQPTTQKVTKETTTKEVTTKEATTKPQIKIVTIEATSEKYSNSKLNKILEKVNAILDKKDFSDLAKQFIRDGVEQIFNNYSEWQSVYKDLPTIEEYINETIIPEIKNVNTLKMINIESDKAQNILNYI